MNYSISGYNLYEENEFCIENVIMNEEKMNAPCAIGTKGAVTTGSEQRVPIHLKLTLTIKEAAEYSNI